MIADEATALFNAGGEIVGVLVWRSGMFYKAGQCAGLFKIKLMIQVVLGWIRILEYLVIYCRMFQND